MVFLHWCVFTNPFLLQTSWTNATEKTERLSQSHNGICFSTAELSRKGQSLCQISLDYKTNKKEEILPANTMHMYIHLIPALCTQCSPSFPPSHSLTDSCLCQPDQYFRHKWGELTGREIHIEGWKHSRKKKTDPFKSINIPNKSWWAWWGDCSSFWQLCNYSLNTTTTFFGNRHSICMTITALGITAGQSPGYVCHNPLVRRWIWAA